MLFILVVKHISYTNTELIDYIIVLMIMEVEMSSDIELEDILENNKHINEMVQDLRKQARVLNNKADELNRELIAPCGYCSLDGFFRCEACEEDNYRGFNDPDYI